MIRRIIIRSCKPLIGQVFQRSKPLQFIFGFLVGFSPAGFCLAAFVFSAATATILLAVACWIIWFSTVYTFFANIFGRFLRLILLCTHDLFKRWFP